MVIKKYIYLYIYIFIVYRGPIGLWGLGLVLKGLSGRERKAVLHGEGRLQSASCFLEGLNT